MKVKRFSLVELLILVAIGGILVSMLQPAFCRRAPVPQSAATSPAAAAAEADGEAERTRRITARLGTPAPPSQDGLAAVVVVDVSGSMADRVRDADGERRRKIVIAQRAALDLVRAFEAYARAHPGETVAVGIFEFSTLNAGPAARVVIPPGPPDTEAARPRIEAMQARGGTPIGEAMIEGRLALDATGLRRRHLLVVTDGENTAGELPEAVARVMDAQDEAVRAPFYFVAFDVAAGVFERVKQHGGLVLPAKDGAELAKTLDELLSDRILVEAPKEAEKKK